MIGCDLSVARSPQPPPGEVAAEGRVVLLARNDEGYGNLCRAVTGRRLGEAPLSLGEARGSLAAGLFALCAEPTAARAAGRVFGERPFRGAGQQRHAGSQPPSAAERLIVAAAHAGRALRRQQPRSPSPRPATIAVHSDALRHPPHHARHAHPCGRVAPTPSASSSPRAQMERLFCELPYSSAPDAVANAREIAEACDFRFSLGGRLFPAADLPAGRDRLLAT